MVKKQLFFILGIAIASTIGAEAYSHPWMDVTHKALEERKHLLSPNSLNKYGFCKYSQFGEDGIIEEIFRRLNITTGFFVEFGGADGIHLSNSRKLYEEGWDGCYIEVAKRDFSSLCQNYLNEDRIQCLNYFVTWNLDDKRGLMFDQIKDLHFKDKEIDFLSIDIDGGDFYILKGLQCRPKVICIENNLYWHPLYTKEIPESIAIQNNQQPLKVLIDAAKELGYRPVCLTINLFLVREDLAGPFMDTPSDALTLWKDAFRVFPKRETILRNRKLNPYIYKLEGSLNDEVPLTVDF